MTIPYLVPVLTYAALATLFLVGGRRARALKCVLVASCCGVIVTSFTGGASGAVWLAPIFLLVVSPIVIFGRAAPGLRSTTATRLTYAMFAVFLVGIVVGLGRFDPAVEVMKAGSFSTIMGIPTRILMAGYRTVLVCCLILAFVLPLRYRIDDRILTECLRLVWFFSVMLAVVGVIDYLGIADMAFSYRRQAGYGHVSVLGFHRGALGIMSVSGIFLSFAATQISRRPLLTLMVYASVPLLLLALLFTWSRAALLALAVGSISLVFSLGWSRAMKGLVLTLAGTAISFLILSQFPDLAERFSMPSDATLSDTSAGRIQAWAGLTEWLVRQPDVLLIGAGFQNFHYYVNLSAGAVGLEAAHNNFLHILTETGIVGFMLFLAWLVSIFAWLRAWRRSAVDPSEKAAPAIFFSLMLAIVVSCLTQESLAPSFAMTPFLLHFYLVLGMFISYYRTTAAAVPRDPV